MVRKYLWRTIVVCQFLALLGFSRQSNAEDRLNLVFDGPTSVCLPSPRIFYAGDISATLGKGQLVDRLPAGTIGFQANWFCTPPNQGQSLSFP